MTRRHLSGLDSGAASALASMAQSHSDPYDLSAEQREPHGSGRLLERPRLVSCSGRLADRRPVFRFWSRFLRGDLLLVAGGRLATGWGSDCRFRVLRFSWPLLGRRLLGEPLSRSLSRPQSDCRGDPAPADVPFPRRSHCRPLVGLKCLHHQPNGCEAVLRHLRADDVLSEPNEDRTAVAVCNWRIGMPSGGGLVRAHDRDSAAAQLPCSRRRPGLRGASPRPQARGRDRPGQVRRSCSG